MSTCIDEYDYDYLLKCMKDKWLSEWNYSWNVTFKAVDLLITGSSFIIYIFLYLLQCTSIWAHRVWPLLKALLHLPRSLISYQSPWVSDERLLLLRLHCLGSECCTFPRMHMVWPVSQLSWPGWHLWLLCTQPCQSDVNTGLASSSQLFSVAEMVPF